MTEVPEDIEVFLREIGVGVRPWDDPFFTESYEACEVFQPLGVYHADEEEFCHPIMKEFSCNVTGCSQSFETLVQYETHYNGCHRFTCMECKKVRPTERLLDIHIQETHDSFFKVLAEKKPMYQCFLADCSLKFSNPTEREKHAIEAHKFPKHYRYNEVPRTKAKKSKNKSKQTVEKMEMGESITAGEDSMDVDAQNVNTKQIEEGKSTYKKGQQSKKPNLYKNQKTRTFVSSEKSFVSKRPEETAPRNIPEVPINEQKPSPSALTFIPRQLIHKQYSKLLTKDKIMAREVLESDTMMDLAEALPE